MGYRSPFYISNIPLLLWTSRTFMVEKADSLSYSPSLNSGKDLGFRQRAIRTCLRICSVFTPGQCIQISVSVDLYFFIPFKSD